MADSGIDAARWVRMAARLVAQTKGNEAALADRHVDLSALTFGALVVIADGKVGTDDAQRAMFRAMQCAYSMGYNDAVSLEVPAAVVVEPEKPAEAEQPSAVPSSLRLVVTTPAAESYAGPLVENLGELQDVLILRWKSDHVTSEQVREVSGLLERARRETKIDHVLLLPAALDRLWAVPDGMEGKVL